MRYLSIACFASCLACILLACQSSEDATPEQAVPTPTKVEATKTDGDIAKPEPDDSEPEVAEPAEPMENDERFHEVLLKVYGEFEKYEVTRSLYWGMELCIGPQPTEYRSTAEKGAHGKKLAYYYVKDGAHYSLGKYQWKEDEGKKTDLGGEVAEVQPIGQVLVKKAGHFVKASETGFGDWITDNLFIMTKLDPATKGTDQGWVYGVLNPQGQVNASGKIESCMHCHKGAAYDRAFGLANAIKAYGLGEFGD